MREDWEGFAYGRLPYSSGPGQSAKKLSAQAEFLNQRTIAVDILAPKVIKETSALAHDLQKATTRMMVLRVGLKVVLEACDALGEERDLDFGRTRVRIAALMRCDDFRLFFCRDQVE